MVDRTPHAPFEPTEPVSFAARLVRAPDVAYTEVDGMPVLVSLEDRSVQTLTPSWAAAWAALDGRPVAEALDLDPAALDAVAARNVIEVLRRLKAARLVCDAASLGDAAQAEAVDSQPQVGERVLDLHGRVEQTHDGAGIVLEPSNADTVPLTVRDGDAGVAASTAGVPVRWVDATEARDAGPDGSADAVARLQGLVTAVAEPAVLGEPGVIDVLAAVAELG